MRCAKTLLLHSGVYVSCPANRACKRATEERYHLYDEKIQYLHEERISQFLVKGVYMNRVTPKDARLATRLSAIFRVAGYWHHFRSSCCPSQHYIHTSPDASSRVGLPQSIGCILCRGGVRALQRWIARKTKLPPFQQEPFAETVEMQNVGIPGKTRRQPAHLEQSGQPLKGFRRR